MKSKTGFQLPPDVSFEKQRLSNAWAYVFRHRLLGEIGRILLQELDDGRCHISCEVVGDPSDPMTTQRAAIFKPLGLELTRQMEAVMGRTREDAGSVDLPPRLPKTKEVIESAPGSVCYEALSLTLLLFLANTLAATNKPRIVYEVTEIDIWPSDFRFTCRLASY